MRYLIVSSNGLGNMILKTPMFTALNAIDPDAQIDVLASNRAGAVDVIKGLPQLGQASELDSDFSKERRRDVINRINQRHYDAALLAMDAGAGWFLKGLYRSNVKKIVQHCVVPGKRIWHRAQFVLLHRRVSFVPWLAGRHEIDLNLDLVQALRKKPLPRDYTTMVSYQPDADVGRQLGLPERYVCLQIGAAEGLNTPKRWPLGNFSRLIVALEEGFPDLGIVAVGSPKEAEMFVAPLMEQHPGLINTAGRTNINQLCNVLLGAEVAITHDSGIMHLANALGARLIALYGPTDYSRTRPLGENAVIIRKDRPCSPCMFGVDIPSEAEVFENCPDKDCMRDITVDDVMFQVRKIIVS